MAQTNNTEIVAEAELSVDFDNMDDAVDEDVGGHASAHHTELKSVCLATFISKPWGCPLCFLLVLACIGGFAAYVVAYPVCLSFNFSDFKVINSEISNHHYQRILADATRYANLNVSDSRRRLSVNDDDDNNDYDDIEQQQRQRRLQADPDDTFYGYQLWTRDDWYWRAKADVYLNVFFYSKKSENILTPTLLTLCHQIERGIKAFNGYHDHSVLYQSEAPFNEVFGDYWGVSASDVYIESVPGSFLTYVFPQTIDGQFVLDGNGDFLYLQDGSVEATVRYYRDYGDLTQFFDFGFDFVNASSKYLAAVYPLSYRNGTESKKELLTWVASYVDDYFARLPSNVSEEIGVAVSDSRNEILNNELNAYLAQDLLLAVWSLLVIYVVVYMYVRSLFITTFGLLGVILAFVPCFAVYHMVWGPSFNLVNMVAVWVILGIGCDDICVFISSYRRAPLESVDGQVIPNKLRLAFAYREGGSAMFVTSFTTACSFFSLCLSSINPLPQFGWFLGSLVLANYFIVMTWFPCVLQAYIWFVWATMKCCPNSCRCCDRYLAVPVPLPQSYAADAVGKLDKRDSVKVLARNSSLSPVAAAGGGGLLSSQRSVSSQRASALSRQTSKKYVGGGGGAGGLGVGRVASTGKLVRQLTEKLDKKKQFSAEEAEFGGCTHLYFVAMRRGLGISLIVIVMALTCLFTYTATLITLPEETAKLLPDHTNWGQVNLAVQQMDIDVAQFSGYQDDTRSSTGAAQGFATPSPTQAPRPTSSPTAETNAPSGAPTSSPTDATSAPTTQAPTVLTTAPPSVLPTVSPTGIPTTTPIDAPTTSPTRDPTSAPTSPTSNPTGTPSSAPTTAAPTTKTPTAPTATTAPPTTVTDSPTQAPSVDPTKTPTGQPSLVPTPVPTATPTDVTSPPSPAPTKAPTKTPTSMPTTVPPTSAPTTALPTSSPTTSEPSIAPTTAAPTDAPSQDPTVMPTMSPTFVPPESASFECFNEDSIAQEVSIGGGSIACTLYSMTDANGDAAVLQYNRIALVLEGGGLTGASQVAGCDAFDDDSPYWNASVYANDVEDVSWCFAFDGVTRLATSGVSTVAFELDAPYTVPSPSWLRISLWLFYENAWQLMPNEEGEQWYNYSYVEDYSAQQQVLSVDESVTVFLVFGTQSVSDFDTDCDGNIENGAIEFDSRFNLYSSVAQQRWLALCDALDAIDDDVMYRRDDQQEKCMARFFNEYVNSSFAADAGMPNADTVNATQFNEYLSDYVERSSSTSFSALSYSPSEFGTWFGTATMAEWHHHNASVRWLYQKCRTQMNAKWGGASMWEYYEKWQAFIDEFNAGSPASFQGHQTASDYIRMEVEVAFLSGFVQSVTYTVILCAVVMVFFTQNLFLVCLVCLYIVVICIWVVGLFGAVGWPFGIIEIISVPTVVGLTIDYALHITHAYIHSPFPDRLRRAKSAVNDLGSSVLASAMTTILSMLILYFATIVIFSDLGWVVGSTTTFGVALALFVCPPCLMYTGPQFDQCHFMWLLFCCPKHRNGFRVCCCTCCGNEWRGVDHDKYQLAAATAAAASPTVELELQSAAQQHIEIGKQKQPQPQQQAKEGNDGGGSNGGAVEDSEEDEAPLPRGWKACLTDDGKLYYQNDSTQQTQWYRPAVDDDGDGENVLAKAATEADAGSDADDGDVAQVAAEAEAEPMMVSQEATMLPSYEQYMDKQAKPAATTADNDEKDNDDEDAGNAEQGSFFIPSMQAAAEEKANNADASTPLVAAEEAAADNGDDGDDGDVIDDGGVDEILNGDDNDNDNDNDDDDDVIGDVNQTRNASEDGEQNADNVDAADAQGSVDLETSISLSFGDR